MSAPPVFQHPGLSRAVETDASPNFEKGTMASRQAGSPIGAVRQAQGFEVRQDRESAGSETSRGVRIRQDLAEFIQERTARTSAGP